MHMEYLFIIRKRDIIIHFIDALRAMDITGKRDGPHIIERTLSYVTGAVEYAFSKYSISWKYSFKW